MYIDRLLVQKEAPKDTKVAWGIPQGENVAVNVHVDGKWRPIAGGGNSSSDNSGCMCNDVVIAYDTHIGMWKLTQGNFENAMAAISQGIPINISIWDIGDTIKPHSINKYFPSSPNYSLPIPYNNLEIEEECIIIITDTMRTQDDIVVWDHNGISLYEESQAGGK